MEISASGPRGKCGYISDLLRRRTPMRVKMGAGQIQEKISLGSGDPCHQPGSTHPGGGKANYFKPARGGSGFIGRVFPGWSSVSQSFCLKVFHWISAVPEAQNARKFVLGLGQLITCLGTSGGCPRGVRGMSGGVRGGVEFSRIFV